MVTKSQLKLSPMNSLPIIKTKSIDERHLLTLVKITFQIASLSKCKRRTFRNTSYTRNCGTSTKLSMPSRLTTPSRCCADLSVSNLMVNEG